MSDISPRCHALVPCAGSGSRAGTAQPKQYQPLAGRLLVQHTLAALGAVARIERLRVVVAPGDDTVRQPGARWQLADCGGATPAVVNAVADALARAGRADLAPRLRMRLAPGRRWALVGGG